MAIYEGEIVRRKEADELVLRGNDKIFQMGENRFINGDVESNLAGKMNTVCSCKATCFVEVEDGRIKIKSNGSNSHSYNWEMTIDYAIRYNEKEHKGTVWEFLKDVIFCCAPFNKKGKVQRCGKGH